jgi:hypothetical protein
MRDVFSDLPVSTAEDQVRGEPSPPRFIFPGEDSAVDQEADRLVALIDALDARVPVRIRRRRHGRTHSVAAPPSGQNDLDELGFFVELVRLGVFRLDSLGRVWRRWVWHDARKCLVRLREEVRGDIVHTHRWTMCVLGMWGGGYRRRIEAHRLVYHLLVRPLDHPNMLIHHVNGIKSDNRPSNLAAPRRRDQTARVVAETLRAARG